MLKLERIANVAEEPKELDLQIDLKPRLRCALRLSVLADAAMKNSGPSDFICAIIYFSITHETQGGRVYHIYYVPDS